MEKARVELPKGGRQVKQAKLPTKGLEKEALGGRQRVLLPMEQLLQSKHRDKGQLDLHGPLLVIPNMGEAVPANREIHQVDDQRQWEEDRRSIIGSSSSSSSS